MYEYVTKPTGAHSWPTMKLYVKGDRSQVTYMHAESTQPSWAYNMFSKMILIANSSNSTDGFNSYEFDQKSVQKLRFFVLGNLTLTSFIARA